MDDTLIPRQRSDQIGFIGRLCACLALCADPSEHTPHAYDVSFDHDCIRFNRHGTDAKRAPRTEPYELLVAWSIDDDQLRFDFAAPRTRVTDRSYLIHTNEPFEIIHQLHSAIAHQLVLFTSGNTSYADAFLSVLREHRGPYYTHTSTSEELCPICFLPLTEGAVRLACHHTFHDKCARKWHWIGGGQCAICRSSTTPPKYSV